MTYNECDDVDLLVGVGGLADTDDDVRITNKNANKNPIIVFIFSSLLVSSISLKLFHSHTFDEVFFKILATKSRTKLNSLKIKAVQFSSPQTNCSKYVIIGQILGNHFSTI